MFCRRNGGLFFVCLTIGLTLQAGCDNISPQLAGGPTQPSKLANDTGTDENAGLRVPQPAETGVGRRSQNYQGEEGFVVTPIRALFTAEEKIVFEIQIPHAMQLYKAVNEYAPKSHEEFMQHIIRANKIRLPEIPDGKKYEYDPEQEQLMVR